MSTVTNAIERFDFYVARSIQSWPGWLHPIMTAASVVGHPATVTAVALTGLGLAAYKRRYDLAIMIVIAIVALTFSPVLKFIWHRTRPLTASGSDLGTYSFPSGHTYASTLIYGLAAYLAYRYLPGRWRVVVPSLLVSLIVLVGVSRVYLGAHFPTDVLGGWILGAVVLTIIIKSCRLKP